MFSEGTVHPHIAVMWMLYYHSTDCERDQTLPLHCQHPCRYSVSTYTEDHGQTSCSFPLLYFVYACANTTVSYDIFKLVLISGRSCTFVFFSLENVLAVLDLRHFHIYCRNQLVKLHRVLLLFWIGTAKLYRSLWERTEDLTMSRMTTKGQRFLSCLKANTLAWRSWHKMHPWIRDEGLYNSQDSIIVWA